MKLPCNSLILAFLTTLPGILAAGDSAQYIIMQDQTQNPKHQYQHEYENLNISHTFNSISAVAATLTSDQVDQLKATEGIHVYPDREISAEKWEYSAPWGLDRIDQRHLPLDNKYCYRSNNPTKVDVYIIDTGIFVDHHEFKPNRATFAKNFVGDGIDTDCNGHGTEVAGVAGGNKYGVAKNAHLIALKILDCRARGSAINMIAAVDWVIQNHSKRSVINMSFRIPGPVYPPLDAAVQAAIDAGIHVVIAGGNEDQDACVQSPQDSPHAIKVAASDRHDRRASFSSFGSCVDLFAPGVDIQSSSIPNVDSTSVGNGTSYSAPFVTGAVAVLLQDHDWKPKTMKKNILDMATPGEIYDRHGSPNLLLYVGHSAC